MIPLDIKIVVIYVCSRITTWGAEQFQCVITHHRASALLHLNDLPVITDGFKITHNPRVHPVSHCSVYAKPPSYDVFIF